MIYSICLFPSIHNETYQNQMNKNQPEQQIGDDPSAKGSKPQLTDRIKSTETTPRSSSISDVNFINKKNPKTNSGKVDKSVQSHLDSKRNSNENSRQSLNEQGQKNVHQLRHKNGNENNKDKVGVQHHDTSDGKKFISYGISIEYMIVIFFVFPIRFTFKHFRSRIVNNKILKNLYLKFQY
ncbi:hypothetical protein RF11_04161 [Thelohanellus kitauei]|uniref:Uncharacterized protein n=1 Tax=Thelohanellus kitauei TaxID=669202 RepID=A0A0C2JX27_THEKT|nr:hypothetical protein RF11_04161 [Thelohanellus kitauei]